MPLFYLPPIRRRLRYSAALKADRMAGALATNRRAKELGITWRVVGRTRGFAAVYGVEICGGVWPADARPTLRLHGRAVVDEHRHKVETDELLKAMAEIDVESWEAVTEPQAAFRFRPYGAMFVVGLVPPSRYTRGLSEEEANAAVRIWEASSRLLRLSPGAPPGR